MLLLIIMPLNRAVEMRNLWEERREEVRFPAALKDATVEPTGVVGRRVAFAHDFDMRDAGQLRDVLRLLFLADEMGLSLDTFIARRLPANWRTAPQTEPHYVVA